jgi:DNA polymerase (family 10)
MCWWPATAAEPIMTASRRAPQVAVVLARGAKKLSLKTRAGPADRRAGGADRVVGRGAGLFHRLEGPQRAHPRPGGEARAAHQRVRRLRGRGEGARLGGAEEAEIFAAVGLPWIPPELREDKGEIEAGLAGALPRSIEVGDLRGDLHMHTTETDGRNSLEEMILAAAELGRDYIAITDHSYNLRLVNGLDPERLAAQGREIDELNERFAGRPRILRGIEADILLDGSIDLGPQVLGTLDWVIGSVHAHFKMTARRADPAHRDRHRVGADRRARPPHRAPAGDALG